ncbi:MAG: hypothetical protein KAS32_25090 [Candidatus Peribacteraceae bacterium]|nr:hypothetical protein [Candidatus Peribacteraceae bacterium]
MSTPWAEVPNGTSFELLQDLYSMQEVHSDLHYQLLSKAEVDGIISISYKAGSIFTYDDMDDCLHHEDGEIGIDPDGAVDETFYRKILEE